MPTFRGPVRPNSPLASPCGAWLCALALVLALALAPTRGDALCDVIPSATDFFRGSLGSITTPALIPGLPVDVIVRSVVCTQDARSAAPDFLDAGGAALTAADLSVALVFQPLDPSAPRNGVWLRPSCAGVGPIAIPGPGAAGEVFCLDGAAAEYDVVEVDLGGGTLQKRLRFTMPDTDDLLLPAGDGLGLAGPAKVAVLLADAPFPVGLATTVCRDFAGALVSCADFLYKRDSTCNTTSADVEPAAIHVTALPVPNDFAAICEKEDPESPCLREPGDPSPPVLFTTDIAGNLWVPMDYTDVLVRVLGEPFPQLVAGALAAGGTTVEVPSEAFLESRAPNWALLPPLFGPATDPSAVGELFGSVDARVGVHRVLRRSPNFQECSGGARDGLPCFDAVDCPGAGGTCEPGTCTGNTTVCSADATCAGAGECGPSNFDFAGAAAGEGCSSVVGVCPPEFPCTTRGAVRLEVVSSGSTEDRAIPTPVNECVAEAAAIEAGNPAPASTNIGTDLRDEALLIYDRTTFAVQKIGQGGARGRAVTRIQHGPFSFDSTVAEEDLIAHLESEFQEGCAEGEFCDRNENGIAADDFLRVYRLGAPGAVSADDLMSTAVVTALATPPTLAVSGDASPDGLLLAVEAEARIDSKPVVLSDGLVFSRVDPLDNEERELERTARASDDGPGTPGVLADRSVFEARVSAGGDLVIFTTVADNLLDEGEDGNEVNDVYLRDRKGVATTRRVSVPSCAQQASEETEGDDRSRSGDISADGRWAVFASEAENLVLGDTNGEQDIFLRDMQATCAGYPSGDEATVLLSRTSTALANGSSRNPRISASGRFVVWSSFASNLVAGDPGSNSDIFLLDRDSNGDGVFDDPAPLERIAPEDDFASLPDVSEGGVVAFQESEIEGPPSVSVDDGDGASILNGLGTSAERPSISADGRFVAFTLFTNATESVNAVVFDRENGSLRTALSATSPPECFETGSSVVWESFEADLSADGRFLAVSTDAGFDEDDEDSVTDIYREDLATGALGFVSDTGPYGYPDNPSISARGNMVSFIDETGEESVSSWLSGPASRQETGAFLSVMDTRGATPEIHVLDLPADYVSVSHGRAIVAAEGENVKLFRYACDGDVSLSCSADAECNGSGPCVPIVEDLLRPSVAREGAVAIDEDFACAIVESGGEEVVACHEIGTPPTSSLDDVLDGADDPVPAVSIQVFDGKLAVKVPDGDGNFVFYSADLTNSGPLVPHDYVKDLVLGQVACFTVPEPVLEDNEDPGCDLDDDGDCNNDIMSIVVDLGDPDAEVLNCERLSVPCDLGPCDPQKPHNVIGRTCKHLIDEALVGTDFDGETGGTPELGGDPNVLEKLIGRCTPNEDGTEAISEVGSPVDLESNSGENPVEEGQAGDTDVAQTGLCINDTTGRASTPCLTSAECSVGRTCSTQLFPVTLVSSDRDRDGILDRNDNCPDVPNPGQKNFDAVAEAPENVGDACDPFSCGDGVVQSAEECDLGAANGTGSCTAECTVPPLSCPCFEPSDLTAPIHLCLQLGSWSGFFTLNQSFGWGGYQAYVRPNMCSYVQGRARRFHFLAPQQTADCRQLLINAASDQGARCISY